MITRKLKRKDNIENLLYDLFRPEDEYVFKDWTKLLEYQFESLEECFDFLKSCLSNDVLSIIDMYKHDVENCGAVCIDANTIKEYKKNVAMLDLYHSFVDSAVPYVRELIKKYEFFSNKKPAVNHFHRYRFLYMFDPHKPKFDLLNRARNYSVFSWHTETGRVFYVGYGSGIPCPEQKHNMQSKYWQLLLENYNINYKIEASGLTEGEALILSSCLQREYTCNGEFLLGYTAESYRHELNENYFDSRIIDNVFIDDFYTVYFPDVAQENYEFDTPTVESLSIIAFANDRWSEKTEKVKEWVLDSNGAVRKAVGKTTKCVIVNEGFIDLTLYLECKNNKSLICLIDDVIDLIESLGRYEDFGEKVRVPKYNVNERDSLRHLLANWEERINKFMTLDDTTLWNQYARANNVQTMLLSLWALVKKGETDKIHEIISIYESCGLFEEALELRNSALNDGLVREWQKEMFVFRIRQLKRYINAEKDKTASINGNLSQMQ